jgi:glycine/D-amino acid oxidase-like deaminating enzyme
MADAEVLRQRLAFAQQHARDPFRHRRAVLDDGSVLEGDVVVWACGAWLAGLFAEHVPVRSVLAELFFLDGGPAWADPAIPAFVDLDLGFYGTRDLDGLGVKAAPDFDGPPLDPDAPLPPVSAAREARTRELLGTRFPALREAPLKGAKTCRYELTIDSHFIAAPHPEHPSVFLLGGGSGHGFKHGPVIGRYVVERIKGAGLGPGEERFRLDRPRTRRDNPRTGSFATGRGAN